MPADAWRPAQAAGLIAVSGGSVVFSHPLIRSAIYQAASLAARSAAHRDLAAALHHQPERQAWQLAAAATGPDEALAKRLESIAEGASAQSRFETAAAAWQRAAELSAHPQAAGRLLAMAATATSWTGQVDRTTALATRALELTVEPAARGRARGLLGLALSLTFQHGKTVDLMSDLAIELAETESDDMAWATAGAAASAAYYSGDDELCGRVLAVLDTLSRGLPGWQADPRVRGRSPSVGTVVRDRVAAAGRPVGQAHRHPRADRPGKSRAFHPAGGRGVAGRRPAASGHASGSGAR